MLPRTIATIGLIGLTVLLSLLTLTAPATAGPLGLLIIFVSAYLVFLTVISFFLFGINRFIVWLSAGLVAKRPLQPMTFRRAYAYSTALAMAPVMLVGLQSVSSVGFYEVALVVIFEAIACIYVSRRVSL